MAIARLFDGLISADILESASRGMKRGLFQFDEKPPELMKPELVGGIGGLSTYRSKLDDETDQRLMESLELAQNMFTRGEASEDILARTGFWFDENGQIKYEIDDSKAELLIPLEDLKPNRAVLARDLLKHDLFYSFYPELADTPINLYRGKKTEVGGFNLKTGEIDLNLNSENMVDGFRAGAVADLLHEVQHAVQKFEKFAQGGSKEQFLKNVAQPTDKEVEEAFNKYLRIAGEAEARNVSFRYLEPKYDAAAKIIGKPNVDPTKNKNFLQTFTQDPMSQKYGVTPAQLTNNQGVPIDIRSETSNLMYQDPLERTI